MTLRVTVLRHISGGVYLNRTIVVATDGFVEARPVTRLLVHLDCYLISGCMKHHDDQYDENKNSEDHTLHRAETIT